MILGYGTKFIFAREFHHSPNEILRLFPDILKYRKEQFLDIRVGCATLDDKSDEFSRQSPHPPPPTPHPVPQAL